MTTLVKRVRLDWATCALLLAASAAHANEPPRGRLVVGIVVDQLGWTDLLRLRDEFGDGGFGGLGRAAPMRHETADTETAAGHATLATGTYADVHGVIGNSYFDGTQEHISAEDPECAVWGRPSVHRGPRLLRVPTISETLKLASLGRSRVVSISGKDRAAIFLAGRGADLALWLDGETGHFVSSTCYAPSPPRWLIEHEARHPLSEWRDWSWTAIASPATLARYATDGTEPTLPLAGIGAHFPHRVGQGDLSPRLYEAIRHSPVETTVVLAAARAAIEGESLGQRDATDLLWVSISNLDYVGHAFGPFSAERVDAVLRIHRELQAFVAWLKQRFGARVSIMLTADHGSAEAIPEMAAKLHLSSGRIDHARLASAIDAALRARFGSRKESFVAWDNPPWIGLRRFSNVDPLEAARVAKAAAESLTGVDRALTAAEIAALPRDRVERHAFFPGRVGDLLVLASPGWIFSLKEADAITQHRGPWNETMLAPWLVLDERFALRAYPVGGVLRATQFAPSLALLLGVSAPPAAMDDPALIPTH